MTSKEIRQTALAFDKEPNDKTPRQLDVHIERSKVAALYEIAAQLADINEWLCHRERE